MVARAALDVRISYRIKINLVLRFFDLEAHGVTLVNFVSHILRDDVTIQSREEGRVSGRTISHMFSGGMFRASPTTRHRP